MTEALDKISGAAPTGKKESGLSTYKHGKPLHEKHQSEDDDTVEISDEARKKAKNTAHR